MINKSLLEKEISTLKKKLEEKEAELVRIDEIEHNEALEAAEKKYLSKNFKIYESQGRTTYIGNVSQIIDVNENGVDLHVWKLITVTHNAMGSYDIHIENVTALKKFRIKNNGTMQVYELSDKEFDDVVADRVKSALNSYLN